MVHGWEPLAGGVHSEPQFLHLSNENDVLLFAAPGRGGVLAAVNLAGMKIIVKGALHGSLLPQVARPSSYLVGWGKGECH